MMLKALIVDDEKDAANAIKLLLEKTCRDLKITGIALSVVEAVKLLKKEEADIIFLDIEMPGGTGFDLIDLIGGKEPYIIFTTAYSQYAIKAIKKGAKDYLLKPIDPDELIESVAKARDFLSRKQNPQNISKNTATMAVSSTKGVILLNKEDIVFIKAEGRYSRIHCRDEQQHVICRNIGEYEEELGNDFFFRVHKSYLINCKHVLSIQSADGGFVVLTGQKEIEISKRKKTEFMKFLK